MKPRPTFLVPDHLAEASGVETFVEETNVLKERTLTPAHSRAEVSKLEIRDVVRPDRTEVSGAAEVNLVVAELVSGAAVVQVTAPASCAERTI